MLGKIEKEMIQGKIKAMNDEQRLAVAEMLPTHVIFNELYRRYEEQEHIIANVKEAFNINMKERKEEDAQNNGYQE